MFKKKQISEYKWKRIWNNTKPSDRHYSFNRWDNTYTTTCVGDYTVYQRVWNVETEVVQIFRKQYVTDTAKILFDRFWR